MKARCLIIGGLALAMTAPVSATAILFNFNSIPLNGSIKTDGLSGAANSAAITSYMNGVLTAAGSSSSANVTGALATANYNADRAGYGQTLGTSDGATAYNDATHPSLASPDEFIMNDNFPVFATTPSTTPSNAITITFSDLAIATVSFDWEIFADNSCAPCSSNLPDMNFYVDGIHQGSNPTFSASVISGHDPQGLGTASFVLDLPAGVHTLKFVDWPAEIGIDNLKICTDTRGCLARTIPEPSPLPLTGLALALLALVRWKARRGPALTR